MYAEAGAIFHLNNRLNAGIHLYNPFGTKLGKTANEKLAAAYKFGLGYDASQNFFISAEIIKEEDKPVNVAAGMQYQFAKQFFVRAGILSETSTAFAGVGVAGKISGQMLPAVTTRNWGCRRAFCCLSILETIKNDTKYFFYVTG